MVPERRASAPHEVMELEMEGRGDDGVSSLSCSPMEQARLVRRLSRGNRGLDDELLMKMNELEELFTAHKMASPSRKTGAGDFEFDRVDNAREKRSSKSGNEVNFDGKLAFSVRDGQGRSYNTKKSEGLRGSLYERYMEKRDAKLREDWGSSRALKEANMKAMRESLEQSQAELKARFGRSVEGKDLNLKDFRHGEKMKSFGSRSATKGTEQQTVEFIRTKEEENLETQVQYVQYKFYDDALLCDGPSSSTDSKKLLSSSVPSSTSQRSVAPIPRPPIKSSSTRRITQPESSVVQSVSNNSSRRKENMKPSTGTSKTTTRSQLKTHARSISISEGVNIFKEEKPQRLQSMRNRSVSSDELKNLSSVNPGSPRLTPSMISKKQSEQTSNRLQKICESKPLDRRGNGRGSGAGAAIAKSRTFTASEIQKSGEESEGLVGKRECSPDKEEELERISSEGRGTGFPSDSDCGKSRSSQESGSHGDPRPANNDASTAVSQEDDDSPAASKCNASAGRMEELPEQNPGSSYSHNKYMPSNSRKALDSPTGHPASWNCHPEKQTQQVDPARVKKKCGKAEKLDLATNASHQPRNGLAEGFKRLFKFGKKSRGAKSMVNDPVSISTTSKADADIDNDRDLEDRSSDDLRKLRRDRSVPAYHGLNEGKVFPDQAPSSHNSIPVSPGNSSLREIHISRKSRKAHRSLIPLPSF